MAITYHLVPASEFERRKRDGFYLPASLEIEGFVHCTDGEFAVSAIANGLHRDLDEMLLVLAIETEFLETPYYYEDERRIYPHVEGPIPLSAIVAVRAMIRDRLGDWIFPMSAPVG